MAGVRAAAGSARQFRPAGPRIQLGASQLKGLVGSYTGHGNWLIQSAYSGTCTVTTTAGNTEGSQSGFVGANIAGHGPILNGAYDLTGLNTPPSITDTGGISSALNTNATIGIMGKGVQTMHLSTDSAKLSLRLTWMPEDGDINFDPPPATLAVFYRIAVTATTDATAPFTGDHAQANVTLTCDAANTGAHSTADGPDGSDPDQGRGGTNFSGLLGARFVERKLSASGGSASLDFNININSDLNGYSIDSSHRHQSEADTSIKMDICVAGFDVTRFGGALNPISGGNNNGGTDPTYTRWLPLAFSPQISSQPFRYQSGALPAPWGNVNCMYSLALRQEPDNPNLDLDGTALESQPSTDSYGNLYNPGAPFTLYPGIFTPGYAITDANGDRALFNADLSSFRNVHSTLANIGGGYYQLSNAGPPGAIREKGNYTYTFQKVNTYNPLLLTRLVSIADDLGNTQALTWNASNSLTVTDSSSGRSLVFNAGTGGYFGSVDAPENATTVHTHTTLTWDASGHCTAIKVYAGDSNLLLHSDIFGYGGPNGDSVTSSQQGVSVTSFNYTSDPLAADPFGLTAPRLSSVTQGAGGDSSSSDDGGSVAGTYSYTYGPTQYGYNWWGVSAHTNTTTDARGNSFWTIFELANQVYGDIVGLKSQGPYFTGSASINQTRTTFSPNIDQPQAINVYDPLFYAGISTQPWQLSLDLLGNPTTFTDPLGHAWQFGYTPDGLHLSDVTDPTNISSGFTYGERNNPASLLTTASSPATGTTQIDYNSFGQPITVKSTDATGLAQTAFTYDNVTGDLTGILGPLGDSLRITNYDALGDPLDATVYPDTGNAATSTHPLTTTITYDAAQMPVNIAGPNGVNMQTTFNNGVMSQLQLQNQGQALAQTNLAYDTRGRMYQANDSLGALIGYKFDKNSNVTRILDGNGNATQFVYGNNNELTSLIWPDGVHQATLAYDAAGRVRQTTDERGILCNYAYDNAHRLTDIQFPNASANNAHYTYDDAGRLLTAADATGSRTYGYDAAGRLSQVTTVLSGLPAGSNTYGISYTYNADGSVASRLAPGGTTQYQYDVAGELTQLIDPAGNITTWSYDHTGWLTGQTTTTPAGRSLSTAMTWGVSGLAGDPSIAPYYLRQISQASGVWSRSYTLTHSLLGQLLRQDMTSSQTGTAGYEQFSYDGRGRLSSESVFWQPDAQTSYNLNSSYGFDAANNVKPAAGGWSVNSGNQVTSAPPVAGSAGLPGATGLSYDAAGNTSALNGATLNYDVWGNLSDVTLPGGGTVRYVYDSSGRRICKQVGSVKTFYVYDGGELLAETDGSGNLTRRYAWGVTGLISDYSGSGSGAQTRLYAFDGLGNTRALLDGSTGTVLWQGAWRAWGAPQGTPSPSTPFGYHGQSGAYLDSESGLLKMGARDYAPCVGRFLTRDPSGWGNGANLYGFCVGDPVDFFDANGCEATDLTSLAGGLLSMSPSPVPGQTYGSLLDKLQHPGQTLHDLNPLRPLLDLPDAAKAAGTAQGRYDGGKISGGGLAMAYVNYGAHLADAALLLYGAAKMALPCSKGGLFRCFVAGTPVQVAWQDSKGTWHEATKSIEQLKQGDVVPARNESTGKTEYKKVLRTTIKQADVVVAVTLADAKTGQVQETITATREHPFYVDGKGFTPAGGLAIGNSIVTRAGPALVVTEVKWLRRPEGYSVYNFVVDDDHTYFVGNAHGGVWVHNNQECLSFDDLPQRTGPVEAFDREKHYGYTPTTAQTASVPKGMSFDHDPPLVQHYYEGDGAGGKAGWEMTQTEREAYAKSLSSGKAATKAQQDAQGGWAAGYSRRMKKRFGFP